jgi:mxaD protein
MNRILAGMLAVLLTAVFTEGVRAHGPTPQKIEETISIKAPSSKVWDAVKDFGAISRWHTGVAKSEGGAKEAGATRTMTLKTGGELADSLDDYNEGEKSYGYRLAKENIEVFPVSFYSATLTVKPDGDGAIVEWIGRFYRADTGNFPPDNLNDAAATEAMTKFFREGLESLKAKLEEAR